jgi:hypothetical protein
MKLLRAWKWPAMAILACGVVAGGVYKLYWQPKQTLQTSLAALESGIRSYEAALDGNAAIRAKLSAVGTTMLGQTTDLVDARIRSELNDLASQAGLESIRVSTREPKAIMNPVGQASLRSDLDTQLRKQIDAMAIEGDLSATGTLEQTLRCLAMVQAQPWAHRIGSLAIKPVPTSNAKSQKPESARFELRASVTTLFAKDLAPRASGLARVTPPVSVDAIWKPVAMKNAFVFRAEKGDPPATAAQQPAVPPQAEPGPPAPRDRLADWRLTAVVEVNDRATGSAHQEAWLVHKHDGRRLTLGVGGEVERARLVGGTGDQARFVLDGVEYVVTTGSSLEAPKTLNAK